MNHLINYLSRGWAVIPIPPHSKKAMLDNWQNLRISESDIPEYFQNNSNVGVLLGSPSQGLVDVDLDTKAAVKIAKFFLPDTLAFGHGEGIKKVSHKLYTCPGVETKQFPIRKELVPIDEREDDKESVMIVELRSTGRQTVFPPSIHPNGEEYKWVNNLEPVTLAPDDLKRRVSMLAAAVLLAWHWPSQGTRQEAAMALTGTLLKHSFTIEETKTFIEAVCTAAQDEEVGMRLAQVKNTSQKSDKEPITGIPKLKELMNPEAIDKALEWLGIGKEKEAFTFNPLEFFRKPSPNEKDEITWTIPGLIPRGYLTWLVGYPKTGKSWLSLKIACDVSLGGSILDGVSDLEQPLRVLYVLADTSKTQPMSRLRKTRWNYNPDNIQFLYQNELAKEGLDIDLATEKGRALLEKFIQASKAQLVFLDSLSSLTLNDLIKEENAKPIALYLNQLAEKHQIALVTLYHSRKPKKEQEGLTMSQHDISGSGVLMRFAGSSIGVELKVNEKTGEKKHLVHYLAGWVKEFSQFSFTLEDEYDDYDQEFTTMTIDKNPDGKNYKEVLWQTILNNFQGVEFTRADIESVVPFSTDDRYLRRLLSILEREKKLKVRGRNKGTIYSIWVKNISGNTPPMVGGNSLPDNHIYSFVKPNISGSTHYPINEKLPDKIPDNPNLNISGNNSNISGMSKWHIPDIISSTMPITNLSGNRLPHIPDKKLPDKIQPLILDNDPEDENLPPHFEQEEKPDIEPFNFEHNENELVLDDIEPFNFEQEEPKTPERPLKSEYVKCCDGITRKEFTI
jgi:KaiC/GvpD/RAD55 family RecA-like ATPase